MDSKKSIYIEKVAGYYSLIDSFKRVRLFEKENELIRENNISTSNVSKLSSIYRQLSILKMFVNFNLINVSDFKNNIEDLEVIKDSMKIYEKPSFNSSVLYKANSSSYLVYINSTYSEVMENKRWIWYKVKKENVSGWVYGHPEFIEERTEF